MTNTQPSLRSDYCPICAGIGVRQLSESVSAFIGIRTQTPKKLLIAACRLAQQRGLSAHDATRAALGCLSEKGLLQVRHKHSFWKAPAWSPLRKVKLPYLSFRWNRPVLRRY